MDFLAYLSMYSSLAFVAVWGPLQGLALIVRVMNSAVSGHD